MVRVITSCLAAFAAVLLCATEPAQAKMVTTPEEAQACFDRALGDAKAGTKPDTMIRKYLNLEQTAAHAVKVQGRGIWSKLSAAEQASYVNQVKAYLNSQKTFNDVDLGSVETLIARARKNGETIELPGHFIDRHGEKHTFAVMVVAHSGKCFFIDARWNDAWLSSFVSLNDP